MDKKERAISYFRAGYNCAQAVALTFAGKEGTTAMTAAAFGGGMGRMQKTCGALTGAYIVIGLRHGADTPPIEEDKLRVYDRVRTLTGIFEARNGTALCSELLGEDLNTPEGTAAIKLKGLSGSVCEKCVRDVVEILEAID